MVRALYYNESLFSRRASFCISQTNRKQSRNAFHNKLKCHSLLFCWKFDQKLECKSLRENCDPRRSNFHIFVYLPRLFFILTFIANISSVVMLSASFRSTLNQHWISATWQTFWNRISLSVSLFFSDTGWMQPIKCESELNLGRKAWANEILKNINNRA